MKHRLIDKFKFIRSAENLSREKLSKLIDIPSPSIKTLELRGSEPSGKVLTQLCKVFPEYALWLLTDEINLNAGQISPDVKKIWFQEQEKDDSSSDEFMPFDRFNAHHIYLVKDMAKKYKSLITDAIDITQKLEEEIYAEAFHESQKIEIPEQTYHFYSPDEIRLIDPSYKTEKRPLDLKGLFKEVLRSTKAKDLTYDTLLKLIKEKTKS